MTGNRVDDRVTIDDVAREANVSLATVSRVVNGKDNVSPETRERVVQALARTGYVVNRQARGLAGGRYQVVGLLVPDLDTSYVGEIIRGIDDALVPVSYDLMLHTTHRRKTRESVFATSLTRGMTDGLLLILPSNPGAYLDSLRRRGFPFVLIDHGGVEESGPSVGATNHQGAYDATAYLARLGHRRIAFITGNLELGCAVERLAGYRAALDELGLPEDPALVREGDFHEPLGYERARELMALPEPPTAIFAANDVSAFGALDAIRDAGKRVPDDVSVIGFDDIPDAAATRPPLTTIRQPLREMGRLATRMLLEFIENPNRPAERVDLPTELVIRATCRSPGAP
jgi:LacI family transcriptional regulator